MSILDQLGRRRRLEGIAMLLLSLVLLGIVVALMLPEGVVHLKLLFVSGVFLLLGLWRLLRAPLWMRRPDEVERLDPSRTGVQIIMRGGRLYEINVSAVERMQLAEAIQQRANEIRLRAHVVREPRKHASGSD